jgi:hypothetical protein
VPGDCEAADLDGDIGAVGRFNVVDSKGGAMQASAQRAIPPPSNARLVWSNPSATASDDSLAPVVHGAAVHHGHRGACNSRFTSSGAN